MDKERHARWPEAIIMAALLALLAGCALPSLQGQRANGPSPLPDAQQVAHIALLSNGDLTRTLDPIVANYANPGQAQIISLLYSGLFTLDASLRPVPALITGYDVSADGLRYIFHLRPDARFASGAPLTSTDTAFSLNRAMTDCFSHALGLFASVKDEPAFIQTCQSSQQNPRAPTTLIGDALLTPDPATLVVLLARPDTALIAKLAEPYSAVVEQSFVTRYGAQWIQHLADNGGQGTSGMYALTALKPWTSRTDGALTLDRVRDYWGPRPYLREVVVAVRTPVYPSEATPAPIADVPPPSITITPADDLVYDYSQPAPTHSMSGNDLIPHTAPAPAGYFLVLDARTPPLDDMRVRQALALALDKTALAGIINGVATNHLIPPGANAYPAALNGLIATAPLTGDESLALALWQRYVTDRCGGVASHCSPIQVFSPNWSGQTPIERAIIARWKAMLPGLRLTILPYDGTLQTTSPPPSAIYSNFWIQDYPDPQDWFTPFVSASGAAIPFPQNVDDPQASALVTRAEASLDPEMRLALYQQAENTLINDAVVIPIAQERTVWAIKPTVANFPANPAPWISPATWARIELMSA